MGDGLHGEVRVAQREHVRPRENQNRQRIFALPLTTDRWKWLLGIWRTLLEAGSRPLLSHQFAEYTSVSRCFGFWVNLDHQLPPFRANRGEGGVERRWIVQIFITPRRSDGKRWGWNSCPKNHPNLHILLVMLAEGAQNMTVLHVISAMFCTYSANFVSLSLYTLDLSLCKREDRHLLARA